METEYAATAWMPTAAKAQPNVLEIELLAAGCLVSEEAACKNAITRGDSTSEQVEAHMGALNAQHCIWTDGSATHFKASSN